MLKAKRVLLSLDACQVPVQSAVLVAAHHSQDSSHSNVMSLLFIANLVVCALPTKKTQLRRPLFGKKDRVRTDKTSQGLPYQPKVVEAHLLVLPHRIPMGALSSLAEAGLDLSGHRHVPPSRLCRPCHEQTLKRPLHTPSRRPPAVSPGSAGAPPSSWNTNSSSWPWVSPSAHMA